MIKKSVLTPCMLVHTEVERLDYRLGLLRGCAGIEPRIEPRWHRSQGRPAELSLRHSLKLAVSKSHLNLPMR
ncbi:hypothetical protein DPMN_018108 [Dreissena polymorpha]|uniref:Uncharacterized protein n=1 Tax=Dreissena polymorpha TaxID=45954 RepID=A0A9D4S630_DREPO|nr:hypothetical protein DPMN_018108 [Dreissena polymorpha]